MIGLIVPVPKDISSTGYIKIVGDQRHCRINTLQNKCNWQLLGLKYDIEKKNILGEIITTTEEEVNTWIKKHSY